MINFKQLLSKRLAVTCKQAFSTSRVRNFFEVDPIFPDANDPNKNLDLSKVSVFDLYEKIDKQHNAYMEKTIRSAKKKFPKVEQSKKKATQKNVRSTLSTKEKRENGTVTVKNFADTILQDPDLNLPYGFGFDDYIAKLKVKNLSSANDAFLSTLNRLFHRLGAVNDLELLELHRTTIVNKTKEDFKERAKAIILKGVIQEIAKERANKNGDKALLRQIIPDEKLLEAAFGGAEISESELESKIDSIRLDYASENLASDALTQGLKSHKESRESQKYSRKADYVRDIYETSAFKTKIMPEDDFSMGDMGVLEDRVFDPATEGFNDAQFERSQIKTQIDNKYFKAREVAIERLYGPKVEFIDELPEPEFINPPRVRKNAPPPPLTAEQRELKNFFDALKGDEHVQDLESKLNLQDKEPANLQAIFDDLERVLEQAPLSVKKAVSVNTEKENTHFEPKFSNLSINPMDFFWGNVSDALKPVIPSQFKNTLNHTSSHMKLVLDPSPPQISFSTPKAKRRAPATVDPEEERLLEEELSQKVDFDVSELNDENRRELEVFRQVRREPYFQHYLTNELAYYSDRMNDSFSTIAAGMNAEFTRPGDYHQYDLPTFEKEEIEIIKESKIEPITYHGKAFGAGSRKKAKALAIIKPGTGKIHINRKTFIDYFGTTSHRNVVIQPLLVSGYSIGLDVDLFIWGSGAHSQATAASLAITKAILRYNPDVKKAMRENGLMIIDKRHKERKKPGLYHARAKYPYVRR